MNFLLPRPAQAPAPELPVVPEVDSPPTDSMSVPKPSMTLEGLIADDPFSSSSPSEDREGDEAGDASGAATKSDLKTPRSSGNHTDVAGDEGWIVIPNKKLPEGWSDTSEISQFLCLDRSFVFPGEQIYILLCLSASKQESDIITPFRVAAMISKNGISANSGKQKMGHVGNKENNLVVDAHANGDFEETGGLHDEKGGTASKTEDVDSVADVIAPESLVRMEDHKQQTAILLESFRNSNFFVRFADSNEPLWSKRNTAESSMVTERPSRGPHFDDGETRASTRKFFSAIIDKGSFDGAASGGIARDTVRCYSLENGDIVVLLRVTVGIHTMKDPVLEVLQFEKLQPNHEELEHNLDSLSSDSEDPCKELLNWLLPLDHTLPSPSPLPPPPLITNPTIVKGHQRSSSAAGSQIFSFGHFRSYSMSSLPQTGAPAVSPATPKPAFELDEFDNFTQEKPMEAPDIRNENQLSFRGVPLEPDRFSAHCGLEGIYLPGRRWRKKLEIIQPVEICSFATKCDTKDLLCVQVKNVSPDHLPDLVIYLDAITLVYEEAFRSDPSVALPVASIESGNGHSLPNLALRKGEEHSFILRPAASTGRDFKGGTPSAMASHSKMGANVSSIHLTSRANEGTKASPSAEKFAVLVSCRCNYTESKLFFKQPTSWQPRVARDLMISVVSEMTELTSGSLGCMPQLPVQVLTLQASNLTSEDQTLTVHTPVSSACPPIGSLTSARTSTLGSFVGFPMFTTRDGEDKRGNSTQRLSSLPAVRESKNDGGGKRSTSLGQRTGTSDAILASNLGSTHLWLQSKVPLGCVPPYSSATAKLELLPLTDGTITLDTLQIAIKEKGVTYVSEEPLKIHSTGIAAGTEL